MIKDSHKEWEHKKKEENMEAQVANAFNKLLEEYDETTKIRENRENLIMKFK